jgi:hypothetical protein
LDDEVTLTTTKATMMTTTMATAAKARVEGEKRCGGLAPGR